MRWPRRPRRAVRVGRCASPGSRWPCGRPIRVPWRRSTRTARGRRGGTWPRSRRWPPPRAWTGTAAGRGRGRRSMPAGWRARGAAAARGRDRTGAVRTAATGAGRRSAAGRGSAPPSTCRPRGEARSRGPGPRYTCVVDDVVAVRVFLDNRVWRYFMTWGRIQDDRRRPRARADRAGPCRRVHLEGTPVRAELCAYLRDAAAEPYFYEGMWNFSTAKIPLDRRYKRWRRRMDRQMRQGRHLYFLGCREWLGEEPERSD